MSSLEADERGYKLALMSGYNIGRLCRKTRWSNHRSYTLHNSTLFAIDCCGSECGSICSLHTSVRTSGEWLRFCLPFADNLPVGSAFITCWVFSRARNVDGLFAHFGLLWLTLIRHHLLPVSSLEIVGKLKELFLSRSLSFKLLTEMLHMIVMHVSRNGAKRVSHPGLIWKSNKIKFGKQQKAWKISKVAKTERI